MAMEVEKIRDPPSPWTILAAMSAEPDHDKAAKRDPRVNMIVPRRKRRFRPYMSASFPKGIMQTAAVRT
jgi:hypothetical protein